MVDFQYLSEAQTRKLKIDVLLREQGWDVSDRSRIVAEVDTKQSDFISHKYKTVDQTLKNDLQSKYVDYLLLDGYGAPLAIIEAKRTSRDPVVGKKQAEQYADDIKNQTRKDVFIFLTNGYEIWLWDRQRYPLRQIKGFYTRSDLERLRFQNEHLITEHVRVNTDIADRPKSIENVKRIQEHIHNSRRKALIVMATGTGKTRVAMAIIDILMRERRGDSAGKCASPFSGKNFWMVVNTTPPEATFSSDCRCSRDSACNGPCLSRSWQEQNVPYS